MTTAELADPFIQMPPAIRAFATRHKLGREALRSDGSLTLTVDRRYRLRMRSAPHSKVALIAKLLTLPSDSQRKADEVLARLARTAAGMLQKHASTLCLDARQQSLLLQQTFPANADARAVEEALADFSNALAFWSKLCWSEAAALQMN